MLVLSSTTRPKPLSDHILVLLDPLPDTKTSQDDAEESPVDARIGKVIEVGPGRFSENGTLIPMQLGTGHRVVLAPYAGDDIQINTDTFRLIRECDVWLIV